MAPPISTPDSFIASLICKLSSLSSPSTPIPNHSTDSSSIPSYPALTNNPDASISKSTPSPIKLQSFSTILSVLPEETQKSITSLLTTLHFLFPHEFIPALDLLDRMLVTRMIARSEQIATTVSDGRDLFRSRNALPGRTDQSFTSEIHLEKKTSVETNAKVAATREAEMEVFYVQSASSQTRLNLSRNGRRRQLSNTSISYEVRLASWNCTCPAFALSAFSRVVSMDSNHNDDHDPCHHQLYFDNAQPSDKIGEMGTTKSEAGDVWMFGGSLTRTLPESSEPDVQPPPLPTPVCKHILAAVLGKYVPGLFGSGVYLRIVNQEEAAGWAGGWGDGD